MNKILLIKFVACFLFIVLMSIGILFTKIDFPFAIFFLIPIVIFSIQKEVQIVYILALSVFASMAWMLIYCLTAHCTINFVVLTNAFLRFGIYFSVSYLLMQLKKQQLELIKKNKELIELNQEKNIILGTAAHDIRNSAGAIKAFSDVLLKNIESKENPEKAYRITSIINDSSDSLLKLVTSLLDFSKIDAGQIHLNKILTDYNSFIEGRIDLLQIIAQQKNVTIIFRKNPELKSINFDPIYLTEVIDNLVSNAIKFSNPNSEINVIIKVTDNWLRTEVIDSGIGIMCSEYENIFKVFQKTSNKPTSGEKSTGLGLAIALKVIKLHGGDIGVESKINEGSTFYFTLPL